LAGKVAVLAVTAVPMPGVSWSRECPVLPCTAKSLYC